MSRSPFPAAIAEASFEASSPPVGEWCRDKQIIQSNNGAIHRFVEGRLMDAHYLFMQSSQLQVLSFYDERNGAQEEYCCRWFPVDLTSTLAANSNMNLSDVQKRLLSHIFMRFLIIDGDDTSSAVVDTLPPSNVGGSSQRQQENTATTETLPPESQVPNIYHAKLDWAVNYNLALITQILGLVIPESPTSMSFRATSFDLYEKVSLDIVDWYNDDGYAPLSVAILLMAIFNNQGAMYCQLAVRLEIETYWGQHLRRIWKESAHLLKDKQFRTTFEKNLKWLEATDGRVAGAA